MSEDRSAGRERPRRRAERLLGAPADPSPPRPPRTVRQAPAAVRWAALAAGIEAALISLVALVLLYLTFTGDPDSVGRALAGVALVGLVAGLLGAAAWGLWRLAGWARGPVIALQLLLGALAFTTAFPAGLPLVGLPVLALVAAVLYLLATPEARLAFLDR